jgi:hypothetical protein
VAPGWAAKKEEAGVEEEEHFLRRIIVRLRGVSHFSISPEIQAVLREVITEAESGSWISTLQQLAQGNRRRELTFL